MLLSSSVKKPYMSGEMAGPVLLASTVMVIVCAPAPDANANAIASISAKIEDPIDFIRTLSSSAGGSYAAGGETASAETLPYVADVFNAPRVVRPKYGRSTVLD